MAFTTNHFGFIEITASVKVAMDSKTNWEQQTRKNKRMIFLTVKFWPYSIHHSKHMLWIKPRKSKWTSCSVWWWVWQFVCSPLSTLFSTCFNMCICKPSLTCPCLGPLLSLEAHSKNGGLSNNSQQRPYRHLPKDQCPSAFRPRCVVVQNHEPWVFSIGPLQNCKTPAELWELQIEMQPYSKE